MYLMVNGTEALACHWGGPHACYLTPAGFAEHLKEGVNSVAVDVVNGGGPGTYGYEIRRNGIILHAGACGRWSFPCRGFAGRRRVVEFTIDYSKQAEEGSIPSGQLPGGLPVR